MSKSKGHNFVIQTRQKDDLLFERKPDADAVAAGDSIQFPTRRVVGYGVVRFLAVADVTMRLRIEEAPTPEGPWIETSRTSSVVSTSGAGQLICVAIEPCSVYMRVFLDNTSGSDAELTLTGHGHPVAGGGGGGGGVIPPGTTVNVIDSPGTVITSPADVAVGPGATVPLPVPPAGTRRMTIEVTGGDSTTRIRVREAGGVAGAGRLLVLLGSTMYGEAGGAIEALEVENVAGPAATVGISFEG